MKTSPQLIRVGHSPDPDDAFMFYALAHEKIDMRGFRVEHVIEDIESLNQRALKGELEVTAVSCHAFAYLSERYAVMRSGASVGDDYGPILVKKPGSGGRGSGPDFENKKIAVPGKLTTASLVLQLYAKTGSNSPHSALRMPYKAVFTPFDKIFDAVKNGEADYGLIIHEGQITYEKHGFELAADLGKWWLAHTGLPLPLGIDIIRKDLGPETMRRFAELFRESIQYALNHRKEALKYASRFGRGLADDLNDRFVGMYVNDYTVELGANGEAGFRRLMDEAYAAKIIPHQVKPEFI
ncbi:MAG TPA: ABC transporter substrate-binding protein [Candidatus Omnitrophota bacterium]|jgi:1,4-dihydroxy-6-naphthoate synthase|nr:MAG: 1,4-dihydroxy-6-naphtoate synthase [Candidatus Omnitrophica bacterium ADurb.Bin314]HOE68985.1 ABC transporter substrate-binding protein [Candidatus Omnitrophota bacterium]HPW64713.1 ABC transporter substrate-binding protein [Candidatus Omnitrophota bacterium]HQB93694.1 ABC transporter substrate-binding protein [Candidatus Omnitrophota bacterium]